MYTNKEIWNVTYPIFLGLLAQNVINVTDTAFLGHVGEVALGAAAMGGLLYICIYTVAFGFSVGSQILIARRNGEGNFHAVGPIMWQGSTFSFGMGVALLILMSLCAEPLIRLLITSDTIFHATYEFFTWRIWGFLFAFVNVMFRAFYIGVTQTKVLTMSAIVMALVNVFLDYAMIFGEFGFPEMGVRGAALASVIAEASSLLFFIAYTYCKIDLKKYGLNRFGRFDWDMVMRILRISCFTMVQYFLAMAIWFVFYGIGAARAATACHCQHCAQRVCRTSDTGAVAFHYGKYPGQQPDWFGRCFGCHDIAPQNSPYVVSHHGCLCGTLRIVSASYLGCLYQ